VEKYLEPDRPHMTIWRIRIVFWVNMAADTHSEYLIFFSTAKIVPVKHPSVALGNVYVACLGIIEEPKSTFEIS
jgi:hypothetical protein